jgi:hypothetical protein
LSYADAQGLLEPLLATACKEGMNNPELSAALDKIKDGSAFTALAAVAPMQVQAGDAPQVLLVYDEADAGTQTSLYNQLYIGELNDEIRLADFRRNPPPGLDVAQSQEQLLTESTCILLLLSEDFFKPGTPCFAFARRAVAAGKRVVPILVRDCLWGSIKIISSVQPLPRSRRFIDSYPERERATVLKEIAQEIVAVCKQHS